MLWWKWYIEKTDVKVVAEMGTQPYGDSHVYTICRGDRDVVTQSS